MQGAVGIIGLGVVVVGVSQLRHIELFYLHLGHQQMPCRCCLLGLKKSDKETGIKFHSMANLVSQIVAVYQPKKDKVTVVASMMLSITCKPANLKRFLLDLEEANVPPEDVVFLFVGKVTQSEVVLYDPWKITGRELLDLFAERKKTDWLEDLNLSRLSRQYVNGLNNGRNSVGSNHKLTAQQVKEIENRIAFIKSLDEYEEE